MKLCCCIISIVVHRTRKWSIVMRMHNFDINKSIVSIWACSPRKVICRCCFNNSITVYKRMYKCRVVVTFHESNFTIDSRIIVCCIMHHNTFRFSNTISIAIFREIRCIIFFNFRCLYIIFTYVIINWRINLWLIFR